jgi:molybdopterin adenylyltransferase
LSEADTITFRPGRPGDGAALLKLHTRAVLLEGVHAYSPEIARSWAHGLTAEGYGRVMAQDEAFEVALIGDAIVGFCSTKPGEIMGLYVDPAFMRRGIASALLDRAERRLLANGPRVLNATSSRTGLALYKRAGFLERRRYLKRSRGGLEMEVIEMEKQASKSGGRIDESRTFVPVHIAVLTVSDTRDAANDKSGDTLAERVKGAGHVLAGRAIVKDDVRAIVSQLKTWIDDDGIDCVISTGGTGLTGRDVTVEAMRSLFEKEIDGFSAIFHQVSYGTIGLSTIQSRACAGVAKGTFLFALPGSPGACRDGWDHILKFQLDNRYRPCNFVEIMPRLLEK